MMYGHTLPQILLYGYRRIYDVGLNKKDIILITLSLNHAYAFSYQLLPAIKLGLQIILLEVFNTRLVRYKIISHRISFMKYLAIFFLLSSGSHVRTNAIFIITLIM